MEYLDEKNLKKSDKKFRVHEAANFLGITPRILKHYEEKHTVSPERTENNDYREYTAEDIIKIHVAEQLKMLGFTAQQTAQYFNGELDIESTYARLTAMRDRVNNLIDVFKLDMQPNQPIFSISEEISLTCFVRSFSSTDDIEQRYYDARETYADAVQSGCRCDITRVFFVLHPHAFENNEFSAPKEYKVCLPVTKVPPGADGRTENIVRRRSLVIKMTGKENSIAQMRQLLADEARRRGIELSGNMWGISETGPHKKTARHIFTIILGAEIKSV